MKEWKVVFFGTPDFAVPTLQMLLDACQVVGVVTKPDMPKGRGRKLTPPPVKELALASSVPVWQPESVRTEEFHQEMAALDADLFVTAAYGKILPQSLLDLPRLGCINVHASLLPAYRGAAPLWHCVIQGEKEAGVTTMMMDAGMDTGDILLSDKISVGEDMTMGEVHDALATMGGPLLFRTLQELEAGTLVRIPQDEALATYAPMVSRETGHIHWREDAKTIHNLVRGTNPFPVSYSFLFGERLRIWKTALYPDCLRPDGAIPGEILSVSPDGLDVACGEGVLRILEVQGESSRRMTVREYLNGHSLCRGSFFTEEAGGSC